MEALLEEFAMWLTTTSLARLMNTGYAWAIAESLHFFGLSLLIGTVGLFDLRLLGLFKKVPLAALHRLIPFGILGFFINVTTGIGFFSAAPDQYMYNPSFQIKMLFMACAGINVAAFYLTMFRFVRVQGVDDVAPFPARVIGGASLAFWIGVMTCGRLITFYRPPFHWCPWC